MAEGDEKEEGDGDADKSYWGTTEWIVVGIFAFILIIRLQDFFSGGSLSHFTAWLSVRPNVQAQIDAARVSFSEALSSLRAFSTGFSLLAILVIGYVVFRQIEVNKTWRKNLYPPEESKFQKISSAYSTPVAGAPSGLPTGLPTGMHTNIQPVNPRWQKVLEHISTENPSDWRLAILEADIILEETLDRAGYVGDTLGDKLKNAERRPFGSLNAAWEAHKVRNAVAHQGQGFNLTEREARRVISLFEAVFRELGSI